MQIIKKLPGHIKRWKGNITIEYGIMIALVALVIVTVVANFGRNAADLFIGIGDSMVSGQISTNSAPPTNPAPTNSEQPPQISNPIVNSDGCGPASSQGQGNAYGRCGDNKSNNGVGDGVGGGATNNRGNSGRN